MPLFVFLLASLVCWESCVVCLVYTWLSSWCFSLSSVLVLKSCSYVCSTLSRCSLPFQWFVFNMLPKHVGRFGCSVCWDSWFSGGGGLCSFCVLFERDVDEMIRRTSSPNPICPLRSVPFKVLFFPFFSRRHAFLFENTIVLGFIRSGLGYATLWHGTAFWGRFQVFLTLLNSLGLLLLAEEDLTMMAWPCRGSCPA